MFSSILLISLWSKAISCTGRHQVQGASLQKDLVVEDPNTRLMDPETKELYFRSQSQEDEILLLRKQIADASLKELRLLNEKHILERRLTDLRMVSTDDTCHFSLCSICTTMHWFKYYSARLLTRSRKKLYLVPWNNWTRRKTILRKIWDWQMN